MLTPPQPPQAHTSNLLLVTPFTSLLMGPAGAAGAGRCGVRSAKTGGPGQAPEFRDGEEVEERRAGAVGGDGKPLGSGGASSTSRRAGGGDDCWWLALLSLSLNFNPKQKHSPPASNTAPHWAEPPGPRNAVGRGGGGAHGGGGAGPPLPHSRAQPATVRPGAAGARRRRRREPALASEARKPTARRRGREVPICLCVFVYGRGCGEGVSARVLADSRVRKAGQLHTVPEPI